jgi:predicted amidophosphoribosyltransferase
MFCKNCGDKLGPADRFCGSCGTPKVELCPTCGQVWEKEESEEAVSVTTKKSRKEETVFETPVKPRPAPPIPQAAPQSPPPAPPAPKVQVSAPTSSQLTSARVQPVYGKQYELGKDCPNCGEKGQKGKKCSTCKGTF